LKDWSISKELALNRREWKLAIHVPELDIRFLLFYYHLIIVFSFLFIHPLSPFLCFSFILSFHPFSVSFFIALLFSLLLLLCFVSVFQLLWVSSLTYPNLLGTKRLGCCCQSAMVHYVLKHDLVPRSLDVQLIMMLISLSSLLPTTATGPQPAAPPPSAERHLPLLQAITAMPFSAAVALQVQCSKCPAPCD
jgi:hypothetical protein